jgi:hypothetical protein
VSQEFLYSSSRRSRQNDVEGQGAWILASRQNDERGQPWTASSLHVVILDSRKAM